MVEPQTGYGATIADESAAGTIYFCRASEGDTETVINSLPGVMGQGSELQITASTGQLHALWRNKGIPAVVHSISNDQGDNWTFPGSIQGLAPFHSACLSASYSVDMNKHPDTAYISLNDGANFELRHWDGGAWVDDVFRTNETGTVPLLSRHNQSANVSWLSNNSALDRVILSQGNPVDGWSTSFHDHVDGRNVHSGAINGFNAGTYEPLYESLKLDLGDVTGLYSEDLDNLQDRLQVSLPLYGPLSYYLIANDETLGQSAASASYALGLSDDYANVAWLATDNSFKPIRFAQRPALLGGTVFSRQDYLPGFAANPALADGRRTCSAAMAWGNTALGIVASLDGKERRLEWSNLGDFEELALPDWLGRIAWPQLLVLEDGSWMLAYLDLESNSVMCVRTAVP
ncbi:hypothetical protein IT575_03855 [bacterium]|nr:hypothetical protein [bacterium]